MDRLYPLLADLVVLVHLAWVAYLLAGLLLAWRWPWTAVVHLAGLILALILNLGGWYCPLTDLEEWLVTAGGARAGGGAGSFLARLVAPVLYPAVAEAYLRAAAVAWAVLNLAGYLWLGRRWFKRRPA